MLDLLVLAIEGFVLFLFLRVSSACLLCEDTSVLDVILFYITQIWKEMRKGLSRFLLNDMGWMLKGNFRLQ